MQLSKIRSLTENRALPVCFIQEDISVVCGTMIGQQKRLLERIASSQPVKYQKHSSDDTKKLCEAHTTTTRVASALTADEKLELEQHFAEVSQKNASFSVACDSMKGFERGLAASELRIIRQKDEDSALEPAAEFGTAGSGSRDDDSVPSNEEEGVRMAVVEDHPCSESAKESTAAEGQQQEDMSRSSIQDTVNKKTQGGATLGVGGQLTRGAAAFTPLSEEDGRNKSNVGLSGSLSGDLTVQLFGDEPIGLIQERHHTQCPTIIQSTGENNVEGDNDAFHEATVVQGTVVDSRSAAAAHRSQSPLPVHMSEKVIDLYAMDEQVQSYGGYEIVTSEGLWGNISEVLGLGSDCGPGLKLIYFKHLRHLEERDRGLTLLERHHHDDSDLIDVVNRRGPPVLPHNDGLHDDEKGGESYWHVTDSEQFAESEPFHDNKLEEQQPVNRRSSNVSREGHPLDVDGHSDGETERASSVKRDIRESSAKLLQHSQAYRTGGYPLTGNCSLSQECHDFPGNFLADQHKLFKGYLHHHHHTALPSSAKQKREEELGTAAEEQQGGVVYDAATIERFKKSLADTLMWIKRVAVEPGNRQRGQGPEGTGQTEKWVAECASQAQKVRALLWRRRDDVRWGDAHSHQAKQQIPPPALYYEDSARQEQQAPDRHRSTRERAAHHHHGSTSTQKPLNYESVHNFQRSVSPSFSPQHSHWVGQTSQRLSRQSHVHYYNEERYTEEFIDRPRKRVPIGEDFQAHVPPFFRPVDRRHSRSIGTSGTAAGRSGDETQSSDENDDEDQSSRWLGKQIWPPPGCTGVDQCFEQRSRPSFCSCPHPESLNCFRLHVEEERERLKQELGQAFYIWKFDQMGETVANKWTRDEQLTFDTLVKMNSPSRGKNFWDQLPETFPGKTMKDFVSYYFNVFVLRRRAIQNRLDTQHGDSDDDETNYPGFDSEDSDDYESGDEEEEDEEDEDASEEDDDETDKEEGDGPYGSDSSAKLLEEDTGYCDLEGYACKMEVISPLDEAHQAVPMTVRTARLMNLEDVEHGYHDPHQDEIDARLRAAHMTAKWNNHHEHEGGDEKQQLEDDHVSMVGEEELQEVKTWEASHWDEADHDHHDLTHDPGPAKSISSRGEQQTPERDPSPLYNKKATDGTNPRNKSSLLGSCEGEAWGSTMDIAPVDKRDKLLSTNGMIQEFFGNEASGLNASS